MLRVANNNYKGSSNERSLHMLLWIMNRNYQLFILQISLIQTSDFNFKVHLQGKHLYCIVFCSYLRGGGSALKAGLPQSGKIIWKMNFFPGQGKVREFCGWLGKFRKDLES